MNGENGEGWKVPITSSAKPRDKQKGTLRMATWNCFGVSAERMEYLLGSEDGQKTGLFPSKGGGAWLLALQECRLKGIERLENSMPEKRMALSSPATRPDQASGVALIFSPLLAKAVRDKDKVGSHIVWAQIETDVSAADIIVVNVYMPHFGRQSPSADDVYGDLTRLFRSFDKDPRKRRAIKVLMGDFNGRIAQAYDFTGKKRPGAKSEEERENRATEVTGCWSVHRTDSQICTVRSLPIQRRCGSRGQHAEQTKQEK
jgi:exonuclease III